MDRKKDAKKNTKKKLIRTKREINRIKIIVTVALLLVIALVYYLIDSGSYVATVDGNRISKAEYLYLLNVQRATTEMEQELITREEKDKFWMNPSDGQDPWETAKREALDLSKEIMIQLIKAKEIGITRNSTTKSEAAAWLASLKGQLTDSQFENYVRATFGISTSALGKVYEGLIVVNDFKEKYISDNAPDYSDEDLKNFYNEDPKKFDKVDISYIALFKTNDEGQKLTEDEIKAKMDKAKEALDKIMNGEDINKVIEEYTEEEKTDDTLGKATLSYVENPDLQELINWAYDKQIGEAEIFDTENIIYVAKKEKHTTFDDVKQEVINAMKDNFYEEAKKAWSLEPRYNITVNERVYNSITYK